MDGLIIRGVSKKYTVKGVKRSIEDVKDEVKTKKKKDGNSDKQPKITPKKENRNQVVRKENNLKGGGKSKERKTDKGTTSKRRTIDLQKYESEDEKNYSEEDAESEIEGEFEDFIDDSFIPADIESVKGNDEHIEKNTTKRTQKRTAKQTRKRTNKQTIKRTQKGGNTTKKPLTKTSNGQTHAGTIGRQNNKITTKSQHRARQPNTKEIKNKRSRMSKGKISKSKKLLAANSEDDELSDEYLNIADILNQEGGEYSSDSEDNNYEQPDQESEDLEEEEEEDN